MIVSFGALTVSFSEFWFYKVGSEVDSVGILLAYGVLGYLFLAVLSWARVSNFAGLVVAMSFLGLLIESVPVPVVYSGLPFTIVWTSLAWHMLLSLLVGWYVFNRVMSYGTIFNAISLNIAMGVGLGLWNSYMWNAVEDSLLYDWQPTFDFAKQFLFGYVLFVAGHMTFERVYRVSGTFHRTELVCLCLLLGCIALLTAIASGLWMFFPIVPLLLWLCIWALKRNRNQSGDIIASLNRDIVPAWRYAITLLIPICAISTYAACASFQVILEMNAYLILIAGPISVWIFIASLWKCARRA